MKTLLFTLAAALLLLAGSATAASAQGASGTVTGKVVRWNGQPVAGATMRALTDPNNLSTDVAHTTTGPDGSYTLTVPAGTPYWIHVDTYGTWWGYAYQVPFTLRPGEILSKVYFALGPRAVHEITLPTPVSNIGPITGANPTATAAPVSNVKPEVGYNSPSGAAPGMPRTGAPDAAGPVAALLAALLLLSAGIAVRRLGARAR